MKGGQADDLKAFDHVVEGEVVRRAGRCSLGPDHNRHSSVVGKLMAKAVGAVPRVWGSSRQVAQPCGSLARDPTRQVPGRWSAELGSKLSVNLIDPGSCVRGQRLALRGAGGAPGTWHLCQREDRGGEMIRGA